MSLPRVYVPEIGSVGRVSLPDAEAHHVMRVLRLRPGDDLRAFDGRGREWAVRLGHSERRNAAVIDIVKEVTPIPEPPVHVTLAAGLLKGEAMEAVIRDATMMGSAEIVPLITSHVVVSSKAWKGNGAMQRWQRVAVASAKQCGRAYVPKISAPVGLADVLDGRADLVLMFVEPSTVIRSRPLGQIPSRPASAVALIGPEGGWSSQEVDVAHDAGAVLVSLGPRTIRADAMATAVFAGLWALWTS